MALSFIQPYYSKCLQNGSAQGISWLQYVSDDPNPPWGSWPSGSIWLTTEHINTVWSQMESEGHSPSLIEHCHRRLSRAITYALERKLIANNPIQFVIKPRVEKIEIRPLSSEQEWDKENERWVSEIDRTLEVIRDTAYYDVTHTALHTGMRRNELLGLKWKDINVDEAMLHVNRSIYRKAGKTVEQPTKTKSGRRSISLTPSEAIHLRALRVKQKLNAKYFGYTVTENSYVFIRTTGEHILPDAVTHAFKRLVRSIGIDDVGFHDLRHTHATVMLLQKIHPKVVQERLGHATIAMTMDLYSHVLPSMQEDAAEKFELALNHF
jgi:integrase